MAPRDDALARLAGMDLAKVLSIDGSGMIDGVVLERALRKFDSAVFNERAIEDLLKSFRTTVDGAEFVRIGALNENVVTAAAAEAASKPPGLPPVYPRGSASVCSSPGHKQLKSTQLHCECLDQYMDGLIGDIKGFREVMDPGLLANVATCTPAELETLKDNLRQKAKEHMFEAQRKNISPIWDEFDKEGKGYMTITECARLVKAYLVAMAPKASDIIRGSIELGIELSVLVFEARVRDPHARAQMRRHSQVQVDLIHEKIIPIVMEALEKMMNDDPEEIARELLSDLDLNKDGKVTREEFESRFVEAMQHVLGPERMMQKLPRVNEVN